MSHRSQMVSMAMPGSASTAASMWMPSFSPTAGRNTRPPRSRTDPASRRTCDRRGRAPATGTRPLRPCRTTFQKRHRRTDDAKGLPGWSTAVQSHRLHRFWSCRRPAGPATHALSWVLLRRFPEFPPARLRDSPDFPPTVSRVCSAPSWKNLCLCSAKPRPGCIAEENERAYGGLKCHSGFCWQTTMWSSARV